VRILFRLIQHPVWFAGIAPMDRIAWQAAALGDGRLAVVQPILATTIRLRPAARVWLSAQRITRRDVAAASRDAGLAISFDRRSLRRQGGRAHRQWVVAGASLIGVAAGLTAAGLAARCSARGAARHRFRPALRPRLALTKGAVEVFQDDGRMSWRTGTSMP